MSTVLSIRTPGAGAPPPFRLAERDVVVGSGAEADWVIRDPRVASRHLLIGFREGAYLVRDAGGGGTMVNGRPLAGIHRLAPGDVLTIGGTDIVFGEQAAVPPALGGDALAGQLAGALATLLATRRRQLGELRVRSPDPLARNPLAQADGAADRLRALPPPAATAAIDQAVAAIERHGQASVAAMQAGLRAVLAEVAPDALGAAPDLPPRGDAREAALWRAYVARFDGERLGGAGFVERFAEAFRESYERLAARP